MCQFPKNALDFSGIMLLMWTPFVYAVVAFLFGWWLGRARSTSLSVRPRSPVRERREFSPVATSSTREGDDHDEASSSSDDSAQAPRYSDLEPLKMVLLVRTDLEMGKGKAAAQCCHACIAAYKKSARRAPDYLKRWKWLGQAKVTLKCGSEEEMLTIEALAKSVGLVAESICDAGRTQIAAGSRTVLAIGPGRVVQSGSLPVPLLSKKHHRRTHSQRRSQGLTPSLATLNCIKH